MSTSTNSCFGSPLTYKNVSNLLVKRICTCDTMLGVILYGLFVGCNVVEHAARLNKSKRTTVKILAWIHIMNDFYLMFYHRVKI